MNLRLSENKSIMDVMLVAWWTGFEKKTKHSSKVQQLLKQRTDVQALFQIQPQNLYKSKAHLLIYFHLASDQFYECARPQREDVKT